MEKTGSETVYLLVNSEGEFIGDYDNTYTTTDLLDAERFDFGDVERFFMHNKECVGKFDAIKMNIQYKLDI